MGLYKRKGTAAWWCRFEVAGHEVRRSTRTADRRAAQVEERRLRAYYESKAPRRRAGGPPGLADLGGLDVERAHANGTTTRHLAAVEYQWSKIVEIMGADTDVRRIDHDMVQRYIARRRDGGALGQTITREVQALKRACVDAHRRGWLPLPPTDWPKVRHDAPRAERKGRLHPPSVLAAWLAELTPDARDEASLALYTGLRAAELKRMTSQWVEPAPRSSGVPALLRIPAESAKSRRERVVPLVAQAVAIIHRRAGGVLSGSPVLHQGSHKTTYRQARKRIGYRTPISLRDLRHTYGTLVARQAGVEIARDGLGHTSLATTNRYVTGDLAALAAATLAIEAMVGTEKPAQEARMHQMERAKGLEPSTLSLGNRLPAILEHVSACRSCAERVAACSKLSVVDGHVGTAKPAQRRARR
jgi:site-specific recombinase XerD